MLMDLRTRFEETREGDTPKDWRAYTGAARPVVSGRALQLARPTADSAYLWEPARVKGARTVTVRFVHRAAQSSPVFVASYNPETRAGVGVRLHGSTGDPRQMEIIRLHPTIGLMNTGGYRDGHALQDGEEGTIEITPRASGATRTVVYPTKEGPGSARRVDLTHYGYYGSEEAEGERVGFMLSADAYFGMSGTWTVREYQTDNAEPVRLTGGRTTLPFGSRSSL